MVCVKGKIMSHWHILTTEPRREFAAAAGLVGYRVTVYLPTYQVRVPAPPRVRKPYMLVDRPLFTGYLFARIATGGDWKAVHRVSGLSGYLHSGGVPNLISEAAIALVRDVEKELAEKAGVDEKPFKPGDHIRIDQERNVWTGLEGFVERLDKNDRAVILLMNRRVNVPIECLRPAG